jgi:hypothetical protein
MKKDCMIFFFGLLWLNVAGASCPTGYVSHGDYSATNNSCPTGYVTDTKYRITTTDSCDSGYVLVTDDSAGIESGVTDSDSAGSFQYVCGVS